MACRYVRNCEITYFGSSLGPSQAHAYCFHEIRQLMLHLVGAFLSISLTSHSMSYPISYWLALQRLHFSWPTAKGTRLRVGRPVPTTERSAYFIVRWDFVKAACTVRVSIYVSIVLECAMLNVLEIRPRGRKHAILHGTLTPECWLLQTWSYASAVSGESNAWQLKRGVT